MRNEFIANFELDDSGDEPFYFAVCPEVIGARAEGNTLEEARGRLDAAIKSELEARREKTMRDILFDLPPDATREVIAVRETIAMQWVPYLGKPESTDRGRQVSVLQWPKGAPLNLG